VQPAAASAGAGSASGPVQLSPLSAAPVTVTTEARSALAGSRVFSAVPVAVGSAARRLAVLGEAGFPAAGRVSGWLLPQAVSAAVMVPAAAR
jgi:hypothetical protein